MVNSQMSVEDLKAVADALRRDCLIATTSAGSGHATSCMSAAEIMSTLFFSIMNYDVNNPENPNNDEFVLSKGHAAPILYACLIRAGCIDENIKNLRKAKSNLEGHPMPRSIKWVKVATGSLGQGLSVSAGMALGSRMNGRKNKTYVLLGDGEIAEGSVYEAAQFAKKNNAGSLCAIIDCNKLGQSDETQEGHNTESYKRRFEAFGWRTTVIDGHEIEQIQEVLRKFQEVESEKPLAIIARTIKGKGVSFLEGQQGWHGRALKKEELERALKEVPNKKFANIRINKPQEIQETKIKLEKIELPDFNPRKGKELATRKAYGETLKVLAAKNNKIIAIDGDVGNSTGAQEVKSVRPGQYINAYIAEQNMINVAQGLAIKGYNVFASTFASFLSRASDQVRMLSISSPRNNVTICGSHAGVSIGEDGASQMGLEDIAMMRALTNTTIFYPSDALSTKKIVELCASGKIDGIKYIRTTRPATPTIYDNEEKFEAGKFKAVKESKKDRLVLIGAGITLHESMKAHQELKKKGITTAVVDLYCIKPIDTSKLSSFIKEHGGIAIVTEDHRPEGGIGEMIKSSINNLRIESLAVRGIPHSATKEELLSTHGIDSKAIINKTMEMIG
jgi:transketolase